MKPFALAAMAISISAILAVACLVRSAFADDAQSTPTTTISESSAPASTDAKPAGAVHAKGAKAGKQTAEPPKPSVDDLLKQLDAERNANAANKAIAIHYRAQLQACEDGAAMDAARAAVQPRTGQAP